MKDLREMILQFNDIQELPVSEETIGAYLEGNLAGADLRDVHNLLSSDSGLCRLMNEIDGIDKSIDKFISTSPSIIDPPSILNSVGNRDNVTYDNNFLSEDTFSLNSGENIFDIDFDLLDVSTLHDVFFIERNNINIATDSDEFNSFHHQNDDDQTFL